MSININIEHMLIDNKCDNQMIDGIKKILENNKFEATKMYIYEDFDKWERGKAHNVTFETIFENGYPSLFVLEVFNEKIQLNINCWFETDSETGLLLQDDPPKTYRWILEYSVSLAKLYDVKDKFRIEELAKDFHIMLRPHKTICYSPGFNYEGEGILFNQVLQKYNRDHIYIPTSYFVIVNPKKYGGEEKLLKEMQTIRDGWSGPDEWKKKDFPLKKEMITNHDLLFYYNDIL